MYYTIDKMAALLTGMSFPGICLVSRQTQSSFLEKKSNNLTIMNRTTLFVGIEKRKKSSIRSHDKLAFVHFFVVAKSTWVFFNFQWNLSWKKSKLIWSDCKLNPMVHPD